MNISVKKKLMEQKKIIPNTATPAIEVKSLRRSDISYSPDFWNDGKRNQNGIQLTTNCYAYSQNLICNPKNNKMFSRRAIHSLALQPGDLSGTPITYETTTVKDIITACKNDAKAMNCMFMEAKPGLPTPPRTWKVALVLSPSLDDPYNEGKSNKEKRCVDYHWYRQNPDGKTWSHKPGESEVTNLDYSGKVIINPESANRNGWSKGEYNYSIFGGYFFVGPANHDDHIQSVSIK